MYIYICMYVYIYIHVYINIYVSIYTYVYIYIYICVCNVCIYTIYMCVCLKMVCNTNNYLNRDHGDSAEDLGDSLFSDKPISNDTGQDS